ncbi:Ice-binding protein 1 [Methanosarcinales archaeon]|nr:Ice-binding protein 1 [Methanosarcinales archaeon]
MSIKKISIGLLFLILALVVVPGASALPTYNGNHPHPVSATQAAACKECHVASGAPLDLQTCSRCHADPYPPAPVLTTITVTPSSATVVQGNTQTFTASPKDQFGKPIVTSIVWSSSNTTVGTVSASGVLTAVSAGTTTVTATSGSVKGTASVKVTSPVQNLTPVLTSINVTPATANILIGGTQVFTAATNDQNGDPMSVVISWSSSNETVGTIDASGNFSALAAGTTTIKAENGTVNGTALVTVTTAVQTPVLTTIKVKPPTAKIIVGKNRSFMAKTFDQFNNKISALVTWASSNTSVGTIDNNGKFTALSAGKTTITATNGTINGSATITVKAKSSGHVDDDSEENKEHKENKQELEEEFDED